METEQTPINPLSDPAKSTLYFDSSRPLGDPQREAVKAEVERYFQSQYSTEPLHRKPFHGDSDGDVLDYQPDQSQDMASAVKADSIINPEMRAEMTPTLHAAAVQYGELGTRETWIAFCEGEGMPQAARDLERLGEIETKHPGWHESKSLKAEVLRLNRALEAASLKWYAGRRA